MSSFQRIYYICQIVFTNFKEVGTTCGLCFLQLAEAKARTLGLQLPDHNANWKGSHLCKSPSVYTNRNVLWVYAALCRLCIGYFGAGVKKGIKGQLSGGWFNTGKWGGGRSWVSSPTQEEDLEYGFKGGQNVLATERSNRC